MTDTISDTPRERLARELFACDEIAADGFDKDDLIRGWQEMSETMRTPYFLMADHLLSRGLAYRTDVLEEAARIAGSVNIPDWTNPPENIRNAKPEDAAVAAGRATRRFIAAALRAKAKEPINV